MTESLPETLQAEINLYLTVIKGERERRWKLANPSLLLRSHYDYKERGKSAFWVSAAIWCIHLTAHTTWEMSLYGWIYLSRWLGLRWISCLDGGIEVEAIWHCINSHFEFNTRIWGRVCQIKSGEEADLLDLLHRDVVSDMVTEMELHSYDQAKRWPRDHLDVEVWIRP